MSRFEDRLLTHLLAEHGDALLDLAPQPVPDLTPARSWLRSRPAAAVLAIVLAALVAVLALTIGGRHAAPAYALQVRANGTVVLTLNDLTAATAANADLADRGLPIRVVPLRKGCTARARIDTRTRGDFRLTSRILVSQRTASGGVTWTIDARLVPRGDVFGISARRGPAGTGVVGLAFDFFRGAAPACGRPGTLRVR
ncbi:MAG TPA: hypothetical protein VFW29_09375 [Solirubrobacteraceae bacterium]|nr:hypothetical protein [Solirubrobacteraceae bacterium]